MPDAALHPSLRRQLRRLYGDDVPAACAPLVRAVNEAYHQADVERALLERSLELTSEELLERNARLHSDLAIREQARREAERARLQAEEAARLKSAFLHNMSHEIRTPLTGILGFSEILAEEVPEDLRTPAETIHRSARRLLDTINSVLDLAQLESGTLQVHAEAIPAAEAIEEVAQFLSPIAAARGLDLEAAGLAGPADDAVHVRADRVALHRVLVNLVGNALKFTEAGRVAIHLDATPTAVRLHVADTGVGIAPEFVPHLFEQFRQESNGLGRRHEGNGLGLAVSKRLVELMDGALTVESTLGEGSTFTVTLPRAVAVPHVA